MIEKLKEDGGYWLHSNGSSYENKLDFIQEHVLEFCGCGSPQENLEYVRDMLLKIKNKKFGENPYLDKSYMFFAYWSDSKSYTEHGTSVAFPWLTKLGEELLNDIQEVLKND